MTLILLWNDDNVWGPELFDNLKNKLVSVWYYE